jgi:hypothetical protein
MRKLAKSALAAGAMLLALSGPLAAETSDDKLRDLLQELDALIKKGEAQNLADPWYLQDLRALTERYGQTWPVVILDHQFDSRDSLPKAPWEVRRGEMRMDWARGLRSRVEARGSGGAKSDEDVAKEIIGGILSQALGGSPAPGSASEPALSLAAVPISNAFQMTAEITAREMPDADQGGLELGVYQSGNAGYRLVLVPRKGGGASVTLLAVSARGTSRVVEGGDYNGNLLDDQPRSVVLSRRSNGQMTVAVDGGEIFSITDKSFNDAFTGAMIANRGGDYAVRWMTIRGVQ